MMLWVAVVSGSSRRLKKLKHMNTLKITHNAGFFSCCSKRLEAIVWFFNTYKCLPDRVDSSEQFSFYKSNSTDDAISLYFQNNDIAVPCSRVVDFHNDVQFLPYEKIDFSGLKPFIKEYFSPSEIVKNAISEYEKKYSIDYGNTCAVYYRGNDKSIETAIAPYDVFIQKAKEIRKENPSATFIIQTDEKEFLDAFQKEFPNCISFEEIQPMAKKNSFVAAELLQDQKVAHGINFFASILVLAKCRFLVTHSGNGALWCILYRGNTGDVFQWLNGSWNPTKLSFSALWQRNKKYIKKLAGFNKREYFVQ